MDSFSPFPYSFLNKWLTVSEVFWYGKMYTSFNNLTKFPRTLLFLKKYLLSVCSGLSRIVLIKWWRFKCSFFSYEAYSLAGRQLSSNKFIHSYLILHNDTWYEGGLQYAFLRHHMEHNVTRACPINLACTLDFLYHILSCVSFICSSIKRVTNYWSIIYDFSSLICFHM